jgi:hypothetical protein
LAASVRLNGWVVRVAFAVGAVLTTGLVAALYVALWWVLPQASPAQRRGGAGSALMAVLLMVGLIGLWVAEQASVLRLAPDGQSIYWPVLALVMGGVFLLRQMRAS